MEKKKVIGVFAISLVLLLSAGLVMAQSGFGMGQMTEEEKSVFQEEREQMRSAIESDDFATWKSLMQTRISRMQEDLTEENFESLVVRHQERAEARENGEYPMQKNGIGRSQGKGQGQMNAECPYL